MMSTGLFSSLDAASPRRHPPTLRETGPGPGPARRTRKLPSLKVAVRRLKTWPWTPKRPNPRPISSRWLSAPLLKKIVFPGLVEHLFVGKKLKSSHPSKMHQSLEVPHVLAPTWFCFLLAGDASPPANALTFERGKQDQWRKGDQSEIGELTDIVHTFPYFKKGLQHTFLYHRVISMPHTKRGQDSTNS